MRGGGPAILAAFLVCVAAAPLSAQDLSRDWARGLTEKSFVPGVGPGGEPVTRFEASVGERLYYDSNIFQLEDDPIDDIVSVSHAQGSFGHAGSSGSVGAALQASYLRFFDEEDASDSEFRGTMSAKYGGREASIELRDGFQKQSDPFDPTFATRVERWSNRTDLRGRIPASERLKIEPGVSAAVNRAISDGFESLDNWTYTASLDAGWEISPKLELYPGVIAEWLDYEEDTQRDSRNLSVLIGLRGDLTTRLNGSIRVGWGRRDIDSVGALESETESTVVANAALKYELSNTTQSWIQFSRDTYFAVGAAFQVRNSVTAWLRHSFNEAMWGLFEIRYLHSDTDGIVVRQRVSLEGQLGRSFSEHLEANLGLSYRIGLSEIDFEEFDVILFQAGASWKF